jgi:[acyl-carrier-protein] S-malonyltransferase
MVKALVFPGQGSQVVGMGLNLYNTNSTAKQIFEQVNENFGSKITDIMFSGNAEDLTATQNSQVAIASVSIAILEILKQDFKIDISKVFKYTAGHSLGEYVALYASNALSLKDTIILLKARGLAMANAGSLSKGGMAVVLGVEDLNKINDLINASKIENQTCIIANDNSLGQVVLSGNIEYIDNIILKAKEFGVKALKLSVSGAFHSPLMQPAAQNLEKALASVEVKSPNIDVIHNVLAGLNSNNTPIKNLLLQQLTGSVRWRETMNFIINNQVSTLVECGVGTVLTGLAKRSYPDVARFNLQSVEDIENFVKTL